MDTVQCRHCKEMVVPNVTRGVEGMHSRICPMCGKNMESILNQDIGQIAIRTSPKAGLIIAGVLVAVLLVVLVVAMRFAWGS